MNDYYTSPCKVCHSYYGHTKNCSYWAHSGIAERVVFEEVNRRYENEVFKLQAELKEKDETIKKLRERLGFYADKSNFYGVVSECDLKACPIGEVSQEFGKLARQTLKEIENE